MMKESGTAAAAVMETNADKNLDGSNGDADLERGGTTTRDVVSATDDVFAGDEATGMNRDVTEITTQSYGSKVKESYSGVCFGFLLYFVSIALLIWNEGRTVKRMRDLDEGRESVIEFDFQNFTNSSIPSTFENQLIHTVGKLYTPQIISDPIFGVSSQYINSTSSVTNSSSSDNVTITTVQLPSVDNFLKLSRSVSMYQWKESSTSTTKERSDGSTYTETTYSYSMAWSDSLIDSSRFHEKTTTRTNPGSFPFTPLKIEATPIYLGSDKVELNADMIGYFNWYEPLNTIDIRNVPDTTLQSRLTKHTPNGYFYQSGGSSSNTTSSSSSSTDDRPNVGDMRITFTVVVPDTISTIGRLFADTDNDGDHTIGTHTTNRGGELLLVERGSYTAEEMFTQADADNTTTAWILRFVGFFMMVFSILLILQPLATIVDIVPFIGDCIQSSMENCLFPIIAVIIALPTCLFVIALAWLAYRPFIAIPIMVVSLILIVFLYRRIHKKKQEHNNNNGMNGDDDDGPIKPQQYSDTNDNVNASSTSPFNSPGHNTSTVTGTTVHIGDGSKVDGDSGGGGGFAGALDHPPPATTSGMNYDTPNENKKPDGDEEDVVFK